VEARPLSNTVFLKPPGVVVPHRTSIRSADFAWRRFVADRPTHRLTDRHTTLQNHLSLFTANVELFVTKFLPGTPDFSAAVNLPRLRPPLNDSCSLYLQQVLLCWPAIEECSTELHLRPLPTQQSNREICVLQTTPRPYLYSTEKHKTRNSPVAEMPHERMCMLHSWCVLLIYCPDFPTRSHLPEGSSWQHIGRIFCHLPLSHLTPSMKRIPPSYRVHIWCGKTILAGLQSDESRMMIDSVVWAQYINVTDTQAHNNSWGEAAI